MSEIVPPDTERETLERGNAAAAERHESGRQRLPNRRGAIAFDFEHGGMVFRAHTGFDDGMLREVFLDAAKSSSQLDAIGADTAILISLLLQHSATLDTIGHALRRTPAGAPASLVGEVVDRLAALVAEPELEGRP
jgi:hypothetical protein